MFILNPKKHLKKISSNNDNQRVSKLFLYYFGRQMKKKKKKKKKERKRFTLAFNDRSKHGAESVFDQESLIRQHAHLIGRGRTN